MNENTGKAVQEVELIVKELMTSEDTKTRLSKIAVEHNENVAALTIQAMSIFALRMADAAKKQGFQLGSFVGGGEHFMCLGQNNMLIHDHPKVQEGAQILLAQVGEALGFVEMVKREDQEKAAQEPSINEQLVKEVLAEVATETAH